MVDCAAVTCLPIEIFLGFTGISIALAIFGFIRQPPIPAMLAFGGMFILFVSVMTGGIIMGSIPEASISSGSTTTYQMTDNVFDFQGFPQMLFALMGVIMMLSGGLMVLRQ